MSTWTMVGKPFATADMSATVPTLYWRFRIPTTGTEHFLKGAGAGVIFYGTPVFTALSAEIWSDQGSAPRKLIANSTTSWLKAQLITLAHGCKYVGFDFPAVPLFPGAYYHLALRASGYTGTNASHIAWKHSYPDPQYAPGFTVETKKAGVMAFDSVIFAAEG